MGITWQSLNGIGERAWVCGYCSKHVASNLGFFGQDRASGGKQVYGYPCTFCGGLTYFALDGTQTPGPVFGDPVEGLPEKVKILYEDARKGARASAFTAAVMACRGILLYVAAQKGADEKMTFHQAIDYLDKNGWMPQDGKAWVTYIKDKGNEANHDIQPMSEKECRSVVTFTRNLLRHVYETQHEFEKLTK